MALRKSQRMHFRDGKSPAVSDEFFKPTTIEKFLRCLPTLFVSSPVSHEEKSTPSIVGGCRRPLVLRVAAGSYGGLLRSLGSPAENAVTFTIFYDEPQMGIMS